MIGFKPIQAAEVKQIRAALGITQSQLASLVGVHWVTVSKWERGTNEPNAWQSSLLRSFHRAASRKRGIGKTAVTCLAEGGVAFALYMLLRESEGS